MNRKERNQYVEQHIKDYLPQEYQQADVKVYEVNKRNGIMQDGLVVRQKGVQYPQFYIWMHMIILIQRQP